VSIHSSYCSPCDTSHPCLQCGLYPISGEVVGDSGGADADQEISRCAPGAVESLVAVERLAAEVVDAGVGFVESDRAGHPRRHSDHAATLVVLANRRSNPLDRAQRIDQYR